MSFVNDINANAECAILAIKLNRIVDNLEFRKLQLMITKHLVDLKSNNGNYSAKTIEDAWLISLTATSKVVSGNIKACQQNLIQIYLNLLACIHGN